LQDTEKENLQQLQDQLGITIEYQLSEDKTEKYKIHSE
jgi:hypothetical protein